MIQREVADRLKGEFPGVKVMFCDELLIYGLAVDLDGQRHAYKFSDDTPQNWREAADRLAAWLRSRRG